VKRSEIDRDFYDHFPLNNEYFTQQRIFHPTIGRRLQVALRQVDSVISGEAAECNDDAVALYQLAGVN
jgi:hypothetical protein